MGNEAPAARRHVPGRHALGGTGTARSSSPSVGHMKTLAATLLAACLAIAVTGCSAAAFSSPAPSLPDPSAPSSGGASGDPGTLPPDAPVATAPGGPNVGGGGGPIEPGQPTLVLPKPGQQDVHDVGIEQLSARVTGRHVVINARWWSGVEPCAVLDSVAARVDGGTITVSVREGSSNRAAMCIEIAMLKVTPIDLGDLAPGDYTIVAAQGPAAAITVTVS